MDATGTGIPGMVTIAGAGVVNAGASFLKRQHIEPSQVLHMHPVLFLGTCT